MNQKISNFFDVEYQSNIKKEEEYIKELKEKIHIQKFIIFSIHWNESISLHYASTYCHELYISLLDTKNISLRAPKIVNINYHSTHHSGSLNINEITKDSEITIMGNWLEKLNISNMYPVWKNNWILKSLLIASNIENIRIEWLMDPLEIGFLQIYNSDIKKWFFKNLTINALEWDNLEINDTYFSNISFPSKSQNFRIRSFRLLNAIFSNIDWGEYFSESYRSSDWKINFSIENWETKELYRMFKYEHDQIWNKTEANKFFAKEMEYHMKLLEKDSTKKWEYRVAWIQKEVSDFGNDWTRAFLVYLGLIFIGFISYQIYLVLDPKLIFDYSCEGFKKWVVDFTNLANPIPKIEDINNPFSLLFAITKILIVYQIVVALRRISQR